MFTDAINDLAANLHEKWATGTKGEWERPKSLHGTTRCVSTADVFSVKLGTLTLDNAVGLLRTG